jgi:hypothetical protein
MGRAEVISLQLAPDNSLASLGVSGELAELDAVDHAAKDRLTISSQAYSHIDHGAGTPLRGKITCLTQT